MPVFPTTIAGVRLKIPVYYNKWLRATGADKNLPLGPAGWSGGKSLFDHKPANLTKRKDKTIIIIIIKNNNIVASFSKVNEAEMKGGNKLHL